MPSDAAPRIATPLVLLIAAAVLVVGAVNIALQPDRTLTWLLGMAFMPALILAFRALARREGRFSIGPKAAGGFRSGLVGGGMVLTLAFGFAITDHFGWTGEGSAKVITIFVLPVIIVFADSISARLSKVAEKDPTDDS